MWPWISLGSPNLVNNCDFPRPAAPTARLMFPPQLNVIKAPPRSWTHFFLSPLLHLVSAPSHHVKIAPSKDISCLNVAAAVVVAALWWSVCGFWVSVMMDCSVGEPALSVSRRRTKGGPACINLKDRRQRRRVLPPTANTFAKRGNKPRHQQGAGEADRRMLSAEGSPSQSQKLSKAEPSLAAAICHARRGELIFSQTFIWLSEMHEGNRTQEAQRPQPHLWEGKTPPEEQKDALYHQSHLTSLQSEQVIRNSMKLKAWLANK